MPGPGQKLAERIQQMLQEHGVADYILMFRDPDSNSDWIETEGSQFWRMGACLDMLEQTKRRRAWESEEEEEVT